MQDKVNVSQKIELDIADYINSLDGLVDELLPVIIQWIIYTGLCLPITVFGVVTNIINIICFVKQGFQDPVNVSLLGLAVSDIGSLATMVWASISLNPSFMAADLPFDTYEFQYLTGGWPHAAFTHVTSWITALITLERCLCITAPLKVKTVVTSKRVAVITVCVFVILIAPVSPVYVVNRLELKFFPDRNKTLIGLTFTENKEEVEKICYAINNGCLSITAFIVVTVCTVILIITLRNSSKWRMKTLNTGQVDNVSNRNQKVAQMVVMISVLFIACFIPITFICMAIALVPGLSLDVKYSRTLLILFGAGATLESINSSVNIFIYYHMSSRYRSVFKALFSNKHK